MSRYNSAQSYGHRIRKEPWGYRISWTIDFYYASSRLRHPRTFSRDVEEDGAKRFCKKWGIDMPNGENPPRSERGVVLTPPCELGR